MLLNLVSGCPLDGGNLALWQSQDVFAEPLEVLTLVRDHNQSGTPGLLRQ